MTVSPATNDASDVSLTIHSSTLKTRPSRTLAVAGLDKADHIKATYGCGIRNSADTAEQVRLFAPLRKHPPRPPTPIDSHRDESPPSAN